MHYKCHLAVDFQSNAYRTSANPFIITTIALTHLESRFYLGVCAKSFRITNLQREGGARFFHAPPIQPGQGYNSSVGTSEETIPDSPEPSMRRSLSLALIAIVVILISGAARPAHSADPRMKGAYRKPPQDGWTYVHLE